MEENKQHELTTVFAIMNFNELEYGPENALTWKNSKISHFDDKLSKKAIFKQSFWSAAKTFGNQSVEFISNYQQILELVLFRSRKFFYLL